MVKKLIAGLALLACGAAFADEASVRKLVEAKLGTKVQSVAKTPYGGLYEVYVDQKIHYTDEKVSFLIFGVLVDTKTNRNMTEQSVRKLTAVKTAQLPPLAAAIRRVKGDGKRELRVFLDPLCPFCKKLEAEFERLNNVTIYVYPFPLESKFPGSTNLAKSIWCSPDRAKAWEDWMVRAVRPTGPTNCNTPLADIDAAATKLSIDSTPTIVFADGGIVRQFAIAESLERLLNDTPVVSAKR